MNSFLVNGTLNYISFLLANQGLMVFIRNELGKMHHLDPITFTMQKAWYNIPRG